MNGTQFERGAKALAWIMHYGGRRYEPPRRRRDVGLDCQWSKVGASAAVRRLKDLATNGGAVVNGVRYVTAYALHGVVRAQRWDCPKWDILPVGSV